MWDSGVGSEESPKDRVRQQARVRRETLEARLCAGIDAELEQPEWPTLFNKEARRLLDEMAASQTPVSHERIQAVELEITNIMAAIIRVGIITPTTKPALESSEAELAKLKKVAVNPALARILPRATERLLSLARGLPKALTQDPAAAQQSLLELTGGPIATRLVAARSIDIKNAHEMWKELNPPAKKPAKKQ